MYVSVITMSITHSTVHLRFHKDDCPFLGFGVNCVGVTHFSGELLRSGPHIFRVVKNTDSCEGGNEAWQIQSNDGSFGIIAEELWKTDESDSDPAWADKDDPIN